ncbi:MAG: hypothetical protein U5R14_04280 [Gemmatimonadota bacterium]|nr:hypothetical protein [Gemmatimonadota bacterium]
MTLFARRTLGALLLIAVYAPLHRLLDPTRTGPAGAATRSAAESAWILSVYGSLIVVGIAVIVARTPAARWVASLGARVATVASNPSSARFSVRIGIVALTLSGLVARLIHGGEPTSIDELAQLLHARALLEGRLGIPMPVDAAAWLTQNGLPTAHGWASIYPPLHTVLLALGLAVGASWLVGPVMVGAATGFATSSFQTLLGPERARAAGVLLAVSPFWLLLGGTHLSHTSAAAGIAAVAWSALHARDGSRKWAAIAGAAVGWSVASRPWIGMVGSVVILGAIWLPSWLGRGRPLRAARSTLGWLLLGGLPFAVGLLAWNQALFGHPLRLGYAAAFGPAHGLGFHPDPWGNRYGPLEALAYSGADLLQLGTHLFQSPLPALALVGLALLVAPRGRWSRVLLAWVVAGVGANALYWHHGIHMGPRMLFEATPAWVALVVTAATILWHPLTRPDSASRSPLHRLLPTGVARASVVLAGLGALLLAPDAFRAHASQPGATEAAQLVERELGSEPVLVFAHGSWASRVASRLVATGMRRDSVETALRRNDLCSVTHYASWRAAGTPVGGRAAIPRLDFEPLPGRPAGLRTTVLSPGNTALLEPGPLEDPRCRREARADRFGTIELEELLRHFPPTSANDRPVVARDLGPAHNARMLTELGRRGYLLLSGPSGTPRLVEYADGIELLWGGAAAPPTGVE